MYVSPRCEWQTVNTQSARTDETHHSFNHLFILQFIYFFCWWTFTHWQNQADCTWMRGKSILVSLSDMLVLPHFCWTLCQSVVHFVSWHTCLWLRRYTKADELTVPIRRQDTELIGGTGSSPVAGLPWMVFWSCSRQSLNLNKWTCPVKHYYKHTDKDKKPR